MMKKKTESRPNRSRPQTGQAKEQQPSKTTRGPTPATRSRVASEYSRAFSSPSHGSTDELSKRDVLRSYSSPDPKDRSVFQRRNSDPFYRSWGLREDIDSDPESCEQFEESLLDVDFDPDQNFLGAYGFIAEPVPSPRKVVAAVQPGASIQRLKTSSLAARRADKQEAPGTKASGPNQRVLNFRPLILKMPPRQLGSLSSGGGTNRMFASPELSHIDSDEQMDREPMDAIAEGDYEVRTGDHNGGVPEVFLGTSDPHHGFPEFSLDGGTGFKHNGSSGGVGYDAASLMESLKKNSLLRQNKTQLTSSASQQMVSSSTKSSSSISSSASNQRLQAGRRQNLTASELKARSDLNELNHSLSEMTELSRRMRRSMENIVDRDDLDERQLPDIRDMGDMSDIGDMSEIGGSPVVSFPDADTPPIMPTQNLGLVLGNNAVASSASAASNKMNIKQSRVVTEGFHSSISAENQMQHSDLSFEEKMNTRQLRNKLLTESIYAQKNLHNLQEQRSMKSGDSASAESRNLSASTMELKTKAFSSEASAMSAAGSVAGARMQQQHAGARMQQQHSSVQHSNMTITSKNMSSKSSLLSANSQGMVEATITTPVDDDLSGLSFEDLDRLGPTSNPKEVEMTIQKFSSRIDAFMRSLPKKKHIANTPQHFKKLNDIVKKAWAVPGHGHDLGYSLCNTLRTSGGLDVILENCRDNDPALKIASASLLEQCLTTENREYVVENGLETIVKIACACTKSEQASENSSEGSEGKSEQENRRTSSNEGTMTVACASKKQSQTDHARVGTGILEHLFKHSEGACGDVVRLGGLDAVLFECRKNDVETLRHCASALANLSLYGGAENQEAMIKSKVPMWLFPLAFHNDDNVKYYACLAIAALVANKEIEAEVLKSGTLELVEPFVTSHNPSEFARSNLAYAHGQSKEWLRRLVPVLSSKREEARNLAAFHFCMEAGIKKRQGNTEIFREIGAVDALKQVASCPNAVASKYAAQALRLMGEEIPHKLSQQVPLWSIEDVREWVKQIGFTEYANNFVESRVDGDLLLQLTEENLTQDIGLKNGIKRKRFTRELQNLKKMADYSSRDSGSLNQFLQSIGPEYTIYTYSMLNAGVDNNSMKGLSEDHLDNECMIRNAIHRLRILNQIKTHLSTLPSTSEESLDKPLDVFVSYRRSNGSQLASLLKVHLELRGFSVFIDVERLEAGKFDNNLLQSIKQAKHFLLVLTPNALERCKEDHEQKDWVHREIVAALQSNCNIIPIIDNFTWPEPEELPVDMRPVCTFNGVLWIHDYQDACVEKLERFLRGELTTRSESRLRDLSTPLPSASRAHPSYQRMPSQESKTSEKDCPASSKD